MAKMRYGISPTLEKQMEHKGKLILANEKRLRKHKEELLELIPFWGFDSNDLTKPFKVYEGDEGMLVEYKGVALHIGEIIGIIDDSGCVRPSDFCKTF